MSDQWVYTNVTTSGSTTLLPTTAVWSTGAPVAVRAPETALDWLDREIEHTCAIARAG